MKYYQIFALCLFIIVLSYCYSQEAFATIPTHKLGKLVTGSVLTNSPNIISIDLSGPCLALVKQNKTDDCPSYQSIISYDNSNQMLSGKFITTNGFFHRTFPPTILHYLMYLPSKTIIMVDPDYNTIARSKEIIILPHGFVYTNSNDSIGNNHTRIEYHDRYVTSDCKTAKIDNINYTLNGIKFNLLNDTISYLKSNCKTTTFNEKTKIKMPIHDTDITKSQSYITQNWFKQSKQITENCLTHKCDLPKDPFKKSKWG